MRINRKRALSVAFIGSLMVVASVGSVTAAPGDGPARGGKPMFQDNPRHTGVSPYNGPIQPSVISTFDTRQSGAARADIQSASIVGPDGTIYIGNFPGTLVAMRPPRGGGGKLDQLWRFQGQNLSSRHATPAIDSDGTVYLPFSQSAPPGQQLPNPGGWLYAFSPSSGGSEPVVKWRFDLGGPSTSSPTIGTDGTIYELSGAGTLFAIDPNGSKKWSAKVGGALVSSPALGTDGTVYTLGSDGKLYAVAPPLAGQADGRILWTFDYASQLGPTPLKIGEGGFAGSGSNGQGAGASPTVGNDGTIYFGANNSNFYAVSPPAPGTAIGRLKWMFEAEREIAGIWSTAALSPDESTLYFGANAGGIYSLDAKTGAKKWQFPIYGSVYAAPELDAGGRLYVATTIGHVFCLDSASGRQIWDWNAGQSVWTAPAITPGGQLVVGTRDGQIWFLGDNAALTLPRSGDPGVAAGLVGLVLIAIGGLAKVRHGCSRDKMSI